MLGVKQVLQVIDEDSGEIVRVVAIVPYSPLDRRMLNEMKIGKDDVLVMDIFKERNRRFYGLWHKLAEFVAANVEEFNGLRQHDMLKKLQLDARVHCELADFVLEDGTVLRHWVPKSLNFFDTDETQAQEIWHAICGYVAGTYFPDWTREQVEEAAEYWERQQ